MRWMSLLSVASLAAPLLVSAADQVPPPDPSNAESVQQLREELQREQTHIKQLEDRLATVEAAQSAAVSQAPQASGGSASPVAAAANPNTLLGSFGPEGFTLASADGANALHFRGNVSTDGRFYTDAYTPSTDDTWLIRRLRPTLEGTIANNFDFRLMPDFAQGKTILQDAWADARIEPWLIVQFGKFKAPVGLERLQLEQFNRFIETSLTADLLPYRDLGVKLGGVLGAGLLSYDVGVLDGAVDGGSTDGNSVPDQNSTGKFTWDGRLFAAPFLHSDLLALKGFGAGVAGTYDKVDGISTGTTTTSLLAAYKTPGQQSMFSYRSDTDAAGALNNATVAHGIERRIVPQFYYYYRSFGLLGEYVDEDQQVERHLSTLASHTATLHNTAWQLQGSVFLTGEDEAYDAATPKTNFGFGQGGTGAWELVARYHVLALDDTAFEGGSESFANPLTAPRSARAVGTGINWYLNRNFKTQLDYEVTRYVGGAQVGDRPAEHALISQFALIF
jgi:phosphate-selective porin OprO and OprP